MKIIRTSKASADLVRIYRYVAGHNKDAALRLIRQMDAAFLHLRDFPQTGAPRRELGRELRGRIVDYHHVTYRLEPGSVVILRVIDGRMDIETEFFR